MKKLTRAGVLAVLCLFVNTVFCQSNTYNITKLQEPLYIGHYIDRFSPLGKFINCPDRLATLNSFKDKLVIFNFWFTHCSNCIARFKEELALQEKFKKDIQIVMVTYEEQEAVTAFLKNWEQVNNTSFILPVIVGDTVLQKAFRSLFNPYCAWVLPTGRLAALSAGALLNAATVAGMQTELAEERKIRQQMDGERKSSNKP